MDSKHPNPDHCTYFVQRKKRYCKMLVKAGKKFCGEHHKVSDDPDLTQDNLSEIRIVCPLDNKHTVYANNLEKHLKICNARPQKQEPYIQKNINSGIPETSVEEDTLQILSSFPKAQVLTIIDRVNKIYNNNITISGNLLTFPLIENEIKPEYGNKTKKHLKQASAIVGLLQKYKMLKDNTCYIEFGAGRGQLSYWVAKATESQKNSTILLIERDSPKHKKDNKLAKTTDQIQRIRADIADIVLDKIDIIKNSEHIVGITKHLCGAATDLTLRCLTSTEETKNKVHGTILTFCCHHRCEWTPYTGKSFFKANGLSITDFNVMCRLSSWATCGSREFEENKLTDNEQDYGLGKAEREEIGRRCKNIINWGRLMHLKEHNLECFLHYYVETSITLENVALVAIKSKAV
ncbi:unnamed protein product [Ceutorhynchus assimilis]|uniref:tRNA:m(4)X modification enzyme TRM13 n=1 Tax=Ceutorhynchus assimilis TaxID=467358 RepID=A0A9N9QNI7_9CUCU|nr:unnamed protein product [Ceutorhynchus assimilis]